MTLVPFERSSPSPQPPEERWETLLCAVGVAQDAAAFARLFEHFAPRLKGYLARSGSGEQEAEELAQEALVLVWRKAAQFDPARAAASTWIFTIARNLRIDGLRRRHPGFEEALDLDLELLADEQPAAEDRLHAERLELCVQRALAQLPAEQAQVLRLSYYEDQAHAQIAGQLGIPLGTVKSRVRLAVAHLRRLLDQ